MGDWEYHQDSRDRAYGLGCMGLIFMVATAILFVVAASCYIWRA